MQILFVGFEQNFSQLVKHNDQLIFGDNFLVLQRFLLFIFGVDLVKEMMKIPQCKFVT